MESDLEACRGLATRVVARDVAQRDDAAFHDPARTAAAVMELVG